MQPMLRKVPFVPPMAPRLAKAPPTGPEWFHEVKFDGWRAQLHVDGDAHALYSKNGADYTKRFSQIKHIARSIQAKGAIVDCELLAVDDNGMPCFRTLMELGNRATLVLVAFDLLHLNGVRLTPIPIEHRKAELKKIVDKVGTHFFQFSEPFEDAVELLKICHRIGFEGIVSKRRGSPYQSGSTRDWLKTKTETWRAENSGRWEMFRK